MRLIASMALLLAGCATTDDMLQTRQPQAVDATLAKARADMSCPEASGKVVESHLIDPMMPHTPRYGYGAPDRYQYTVDVQGCGKGAAYTAVCTEGQGCIAAPARK